jgi:hypothetical protein
LFSAEIGEDFARLSCEEIMETMGAKNGEYLNVKTCNFYEIDGLSGRVDAQLGLAAGGVPSLKGTYRTRSQRAVQTGKPRRETIVVRDIQTDPRTDAVLRRTLPACTRP